MMNRSMVRGQLLCACLLAVCVACADESLATEGGSATAASLHADQSEPIAHVTGGALRGVHEGESQVFRGIPFAAAPVGELRFAPPVKAPPWDGVRDATKFGATCPQVAVAGTITAREPQSEDCLNLNVFAPSARAQAPVMVFFYGGNFSAGAASLYDARRLSEAGDVVVVTVNYRLGALGFMVDRSLDAALGVPSGNMGFRDQQAALAWVRENITAFGGDPGNVTVFGESAGSVSACLHAFAADSRELAHKFILESGACMSMALLPMARSSVSWLSERLVSDLCTVGTDTLKCLRELPFDAIAAWTNKTAGSDPGPDPLGQQFWPQMDGVVFKDYPKRLAAVGGMHPGPMLMGTNANEAEFYRVVGATKIDSALSFGLYTWSAYPETWLDLLAFYLPASDALAQDSWERLTNDTWYKCGTRKTARAAAARGNAVYLYSFEVLPAVHTQELDYVFNFTVLAPILTAPPLPVGASAPIASLVEHIQSYWTSFARTGDPNYTGAPVWPRYDATSDQHLVLSEAIHTDRGLAREACDVWDRATMSMPN